MTVKSPYFSDLVAMTTNHLSYGRYLLYGWEITNVVTHFVSNMDTMRNPEATPDEF
jgi:hypothetical protein